ncbi:MAG: hypothetical protein GDA36_04015 [Rhodobacteraceae bacterium]|nr:hypothetical protein [Paracoccaceae bacterium]
MVNEEQEQAKWRKAMSEAQNFPDWKAAKDKLKNELTPSDIRFFKALKLAGSYGGAMSLIADWNTGRKPEGES